MILRQTLALPVSSRGKEGPSSIEGKAEVWTGFFLVSVGLVLHVCSVSTTCQWFLGTDTFWIYFIWFLFSLTSVASLLFLSLSLCIYIYIYVCVCVCVCEYVCVCVCVYLIELIRINVWCLSFYFNSFLIKHSWMKLNLKFQYCISAVLFIIFFNFFIFIQKISLAYTHYFRY